jgi:acyl-CoA reductase-like NAD-dependent aldehyde dehydrogenase
MAAVTTALHQHNDTTNTEPRIYGHYVGGVWTAAGPDFVDRHDSAEGALVARFTRGTEQDAESAISAAKAAFETGDWPRLPAMHRARVLNRVAVLMRRDADQLARIEALESGKTLAWARGDVETSAELFEYAASLTMTSHGEVYTTIDENCLGLVVREPAGVVGMIIPWNFPLLLLAQKLPFALGAGCTTVVKPSEFTSGTALELARLLEEAGVPAGVVNVVTGYGADTGAPLAASKDVDVLSFTGSTATGRAIVATSQNSVKRLSMELGGKAAAVVFADADLDDAVDGVVFGAFFNQGECCVAGSRLLVEESVADEFIARVVAAAEAIPVGHPLSDSTQLGPMIHAEHRGKVGGYLDLVSGEGGTVLTGGLLDDPDHAQGSYVAPTVIDGVLPTNRLFQEEIFGPVLTVTRFTGIEEAVELANATQYGLAGSLWTKDVDKALTVSRRMRSGRVWVNTTIDGAPQLPAGGMKQSGYGREMGQAGFEEFQEIKTIQIRTGRRSPSFGD